MSKAMDFGVDLTVKDRFSFRRMFSVSRRVLRQIVRDRRTFAMLLIMPIIVTVVFGIALTGEIKNVPIVVINEDTAYEINIPANPPIPAISETFDAGADITDSMIDDDRVQIDTTVSDWDVAIEKVEDGEINGVIMIPEGFSQDLATKLLNPSITLEILIYIDATKPTIRASIMGALSEAIQEALGEQAVEFDETLAYGDAEPSGLDVAIPAVMALILAFLVLLISLITIVRDQLYGTQARMYSTPLTKLERLLGFVIALSVLGVLMVLSVMLIGTVGFGAEVRGDLVVLLVIAYGYSVVHVLLAVFLSNFARNELQAVQFAPLISFPGMAVSGMLTPVTALPEAAQIASYFIPMTYGVNIFEGIMLKGLDISDLLFDILALVGFGTLFFILAILTVKDKID